MIDWRKATAAERVLVQPHIRELAVPSSIGRHEVREWQSVTFRGSRHRLAVQFDGSEAVFAGELFVAFLPDHEFNIPGQIVADAAVLNLEHKLEPAFLRAEIELLLLDDRP